MSLCARRAGSRGGAGRGSRAAHLRHHAREGPKAEHAQGDAHQVLRGEGRQRAPAPPPPPRGRARPQCTDLVEEGGGQKYCRPGCPLAAAPPEHGLVEVSAGEAAVGRAPEPGAPVPTPGAHPPDAPLVNRDVPVLPEVGDRLGVPAGAGWSGQGLRPQPQRGPPLPPGPAGPPTTSPGRTRGLQTA